MCGIWGISYGPDGPEAEEWTPSEFAQILFPAIVHRGPHAWGWMSYSGGDTISVRKHVGRCDTKKAIKQMAVAPDAKWLVGHVRYATHGDPSILLNNHPIPHGSIIGVHNGVIRNHEEILSVTGREDPKTEVDSEAIFAAVDKWGHTKGLNKVRGDMVSVYVDRNYPFTLRIARTQGRPLVMCWTPTGACIFASEASCIEATGIEHSEYSSVMPYRLLNLKAGKVNKRTNLTGPPVTVTVPKRDPLTRNWHRPHYSEVPGTELSPQAEALRHAIIEDARADEEAAAGHIHRIEAVRQPLRQNERAPENGTERGNLYFYQDAWYDMDTYMDKVLGEYA